MRCGCSAPTAEREADLGEALTGAPNGIVTAEAKQAFDRAVGLDARDVRARYFLGLAAEQDGRPKEAAAVWRALLAEAPAGCGMGRVRARIAGARRAGRRRRSRDRARTMSRRPAKCRPSSANTMVRGMVARLAERLKQDGSDVEGWLRLLRAYMVLGDKEQARAAADDARRALASEPDKLDRVDELIKGSGLRKGSSMAT